MKPIEQLDIYWVALDPARGSETQKTRPCVILQGNLLNRHSNMYVVAPLLPGHKDWPHSVNVIPSHENLIDKPRYINLKQIRGVDIIRLGKKHGKLEEKYLPALHFGIAVLFGLETAYDTA